ncbi:MAG TPA: hypothetical protein VHC42_12940 [Rhizomicrobium sp.]|jgi:hypothetical protein|nr:hypothetical protein [Rhizomicrobium sp.]
MTSIFIQAGMDDFERRGRLYAGDIFIFDPTPGTRALVALANDMLAEAFAPHDPREIHRHKTAAEVAAILARLKPAFIHHPRCKALLPQILRECGADPDKTYFDVPRLRSAYPSDFLSTGIAYAFHPHRDTWYSAPHCQINWWMPVYPLLPDNAMGFYPDYFSRPVANSSETYNYYRWNAESRAAAASQVGKDTREQPKPLEPIRGVSMRYLPPPGGVIAFSGAQLHETVANTTGIARYSIDFRTVEIDDVRARRGAANVDSRCTGTTMRDYLRASDLSKIPDELVELYDDDSAGKGGVLYFGDRLVKEAG